MLNHCVIMGRLVADPVCRHTGNDVAVLSFSVAVDRDYRPSADAERDTDFIDCVAWRGTAEFIEKYFHKGSMIVVSGRLQVRTWTDDDGNKRRKAEIVADNVYFGESKRSSSSGEVATTGREPAAGNTPMYNAPMPHEVPDDYAMLTDDDDGQIPF